MSKKLFTPEEVELLRNNKYTHSVSPRSLYLTKEFKELFWEEYQEGIPGYVILKRHGYPPEVPGRERIWGITKVVRNEYHSERGFRDGHPGKPPKKENQVKEDSQAKGHTIEELWTEVSYIRQEVDFLKKVISIMTSEK